MIISNTLRVDTGPAIGSLKALDAQADITDKKLDGIGARLDAIGGASAVAQVDSLGSSFRRLDSGLLVSAGNFDALGAKAANAGTQVDSMGTKVNNLGTHVENTALKTESLKNTTEQTTSAMSASWGRLSTQMQGDLTRISTLIAGLSAQRAAAANATDRVLLDQALAIAKGRQRGLARSGANQIIAQDIAAETPSFPRRAFGAIRAIPHFFWHDPMSGSGGGGGGSPPSGGGGGAGWGGLFGRRGIGWRPGGLLGLGGFSLATMLGLGPEHLIGAGLAVGGSALGALKGVGFSALGSLGTMLAGGGSDMAVMKSTISGTAQIYKAYQNLSSAVSTFGIHSTQAKTAYLQLQAVMKNQGPAAQAELALAKQTAALSTTWKDAIAQAKIGAAGILSQVEGVAKVYVPLIGHAAQQNFAVIKQNLQPLFAWLKGPQGIGVFNTLESVFKRNLPTAIHAFTQGIEVVLRIMKLAAPTTGGLMKSIDSFFTKLNKESDTTLFQKHIEPALHTMHLWGAMFKAIVIDLKDLFSAGAGEGNTLVETFTDALTRWGNWMQSPGGKQFLQSFFQNRGNELQALLGLLGPLSSGFLSIYRAVQPMVPVVTTLVGWISDALKFVVNLGQHSTVFQDAFVLPLGAFLLSWRIFGRETTFGLLNFKKDIQVAGSALSSLKSGAAGALGVVKTLFTTGPSAAWNSLKSLFSKSSGGVTSAPATMSEAIITSSEKGAASMGTAITEAGTQVAEELKIAMGTGGATAAEEIGGAEATGGIGAAGAAGIGTAETAAGGTAAAGGLGALGSALGPLALLGGGGFLFGQLMTHLFHGAPLTAQQVAGNPTGFGQQMLLQRSPEAVSGVLSQLSNTQLPAFIQSLNTIQQQGNLSGFGNYLQKWVPTAQQVNVLTASSTQIAAIHTRAQELLKLPNITAPMQAQLHQLVNATNPAIVQMEKVQAQWSSTFSGISSTTGNVMAQVQSTLKTDIANISANLGNGTTQGAAALSASITGAYQTITANTSTAVQAQSKALTAINTMLNNALRSMGLPNLPNWMVGNTAYNLSNMSWIKYQTAGSTASAAGIGHRATGGYIGQPGERGPDDQLIWAGKGEAVLNDAHQSIVNAALKNVGIGGLNDLFGRTAGRIHGFAGGGTVGSTVTASDYGGPSDPGTGSTGYRGDNLYQHPDSFAELNMGTALGGLPYLSPLNVTYNGRTARLYKRDIGAGGPGIAGHTRAVDLWFQAAQSLGFPIPGLANVTIGGAGGTMINVAGGAAAPTIKAPKVSGPGALGRVVQYSIDQLIVPAANKYLAAHTPTATVGGIPGGTVTGGGKGAYSALSVGRTDQGLDFGGAGPVGAILPGTVLGASLWPGWPGTGGAVYSTSKGNVYVMEDFAPAVHSGQHVTAGQIIGQATGGPSGIETGWANSSGTGPLTPYNGAPDGTPMPGGTAFRSYLGYNRGGYVQPRGFGGWYGEGGSFVAHKPMLIGVGDKEEHVEITPTGKGGTGGSRAVHIAQLVVQNHREGDVKDMILKELDALDKELQNTPTYDPSELMR